MTLTDILKSRQMDCFIDDYFGVGEAEKKSMKTELRRVCEKVPEKLWALVNADEQIGGYVNYGDVGDLMLDEVKGFKDMIRILTSDCMAYDTFVEFDEHENEEKIYKVRGGGAIYYASDWV